MLPSGLLHVIDVFSFVVLSVVLSISVSPFSHFIEFVSILFWLTCVIIRLSDVEFAVFTVFLLSSINLHVTDLSSRSPAHEIPLLYNGNVTSTNGVLVISP